MVRDAAGPRIAALAGAGLDLDDDHGQVVAQLFSLRELADRLVKLLDDEDKQVRMRTLKEIARLANPVIIEKVLELAFDEDLEMKNMDEQERIFTAVGMLAGERVLPQISGMIRTRSINLFSRNKPNKRKKILAIRALEHIPGAEAKNLLDKLTGDSDDVIRKLAALVVSERTDHCRDGAGSSKYDE